MSNAPRKKITQACIDDAKALTTLPDMEKNVFRGDEIQPHYDNWKAAFDWYNKHLERFPTRMPMSMTCRPCYGKVFAALNEARNRTEPEQ